MMMARVTKISKLVIVISIVLGLAVLAGCQLRLFMVKSMAGDLTIEVDETLEPIGPSLAESEDGKPRLLAAFSDSDNKPLDFVENELIVTTGDKSALDGFLNHWGGTVIQVLGNTLLPHPAGEDSFSVRSTHYLVRVNPDKAGRALVKTLADDIKKTNRAASGSYRFSSYKGMQLLAIVAAEKNKGVVDVAINWMNYGDAITIERLESDDLLRTIMEGNGGKLLQEKENLLRQMAAGMAVDRQLRELIRRLSDYDPTQDFFPKVDLIDGDVTILPQGSGGQSYGPIIINPPANIAQGFRVKIISALGIFTPKSIYGIRTGLSSNGTQMWIRDWQGSLPECARSETFTIRIYHSGDSTDFTLKLPIAFRLPWRQFQNLRFRPGQQVNLPFCAAGEPGAMNWTWIEGNGVPFPPPGMNFQKNSDGTATLSGVPGAGSYLATGHFLVVQSNRIESVSATVRVVIDMDINQETCGENITLIPGEPFKCELPRPSAYTNYTWRLVSGTLPPGLTLVQPTGMRWYVEGTVPITTASGTPVNTHSVEFKLSVPGVAGDLATRQVTFTVGRPFSLWTQNTILRPNNPIFPNTGDDNEERTDMILDWINHREFDIVALQEVFDDDQRDQFATGYSIGKYNLLWGPTSTVRWPVGGLSGLGLFVKGDSNVDFFTRWNRLAANHEVGVFEIIRENVIGKVCAGDDCWTDKGYSITKVPIGPNDQEFVWIVNTHLQAAYDSIEQYEHVRRWQLGRIMHHLSAMRFQSHPVILLGDLNIVAESSEHKRRLTDLLAVWEDPFRAAFGGGLPFTMDKTRNAYAHHWDGDLDDVHPRSSHDKQRLDYILIRKGSDFQISVDGVAMQDVSPSPKLCRTFRTLDNHTVDGMSCYFSDHFGLSARMRFVRNP